MRVLREFHVHVGSVVIDGSVAIDDGSGASSDRKENLILRVRGCQVHGYKSPGSLDGLHFFFAVSVGQSQGMRDVEHDGRSMEVN